VDCTPWYRRRSWRIVAATLLSVGLVAGRILAEALRDLARSGTPGARHGDMLPPLQLIDLVGIAVLYGVAMWLVATLRTGNTTRFVVLAAAAVALPVTIWALPTAISDGIRVALIVGFALALPIGALAAVPLLTAGVVRQIALQTAGPSGVALRLLLPALAGAVLGAVVMLPLSVLSPRAGLGAMSALGAAALSVTAALVAYLLALGDTPLGRACGSEPPGGTTATTR